MSPDVLPTNRTEPVPPSSGGEPAVLVSVEIGWPRCKAVAQTTLEDGMLIAQVGIAPSNIWGTQTAGIKAKEQALARLKLAIQVYRSGKEKTVSPIETLLDEGFDDLSPWEYDFLRDMADRLDDGLNLSEGQVDKISEILEDHA